MTAEASRKFLHEGGLGGGELAGDFFRRAEELFLRTDAGIIANKYPHDFVGGFGSV